MSKVIVLTLCLALSPLTFGSDRSPYVRDVLKSLSFRVNRDWGRPQSTQHHQPRGKTAFVASSWAYFGNGSLTRYSNLLNGVYCISRAHSDDRSVFSKESTFVSRFRSDTDIESVVDGRILFRLVLIRETSRPAWA